MGRAPRAPWAPHSNSTGTWGASVLLPGGMFASTASHGDGEGLTREGGSEGPASFSVTHKEEPEAAFKKLLFSNLKNRSAPECLQRHETSLQATGGQAAPPAPPGQGPRPRERRPEPSPGHPGGFLPGDVSHPAGGRRALPLHQGGGTCLRIV